MAMHTLFVGIDVSMHTNEVLSSSTVGMASQ
jgi:hypothetical protein